MIGYIINRALWAVPVLLLVTVVTFTAMKLVPGSPFQRMGGRLLPPQILANLNEKYGLDEPVHVQYIKYLQSLLRFDFGPSYTYRGRSINNVLFGADSLPEFIEERRYLTAPVVVSAQLGILAVGVAIGLGIPLGIISALKQNTWVDYTAMFFSMLGVSIPNFVLGLILILVFAVSLHWLPVFGWGETPRQAIMPALTLGTGAAAFVARLTRASMLETIRKDFIRTARAKGLRERAVIMAHALKNSLIPVVTILGPLMAAFLTGSFLIEHVFSIPGIGKFFVTSVLNRDYTLIMGTIMVYAVALVGFNLAVDVTYAFLDPRIRYD